MILLILLNLTHLMTMPQAAGKKFLTKKPGVYFGNLFNKAYKVKPHLASNFCQFLPPSSVST